jgi:hypothetical protein
MKLNNSKVCIKQRFIFLQLSLKPEFEKNKFKI